MTETIRTVDLVEEAVIADRDVNSTVAINAIDVNQVDGSYLVTEPLDASGTYNGRVVLYPQALKIEPSIEFKTFNREGSLLYPLDAKFDYTRRKIWIADAGNHRVLKIDQNTTEADLSINDVIYYPHVVCPNINDGGVFAKGYTSERRTDGVVCYFRRNGTQISSFIYNTRDLDLSSSSSEEIESSLSEDVFPVMPSPYSMAYDYCRSRIWWVDGVKVYIADIRNKQVQSCDLRNNGFALVKSIKIEFSTGNAFVVAQDVRDIWFLVQMSRENRYLTKAYVEL